MKKLLIPVGLILLLVTLTAVNTPASNPKPLKADVYDCVVFRVINPDGTPMEGCTIRIDELGLYCVTGPGGTCTICGDFAYGDILTAATDCCNAQTQFEYPPTTKYVALICQ